MMEQTAEELHTIADFIRWGASRFNEANLFFGHGTDNAIDEALALVLYALHLPHNIPKEFWTTRLTYKEKIFILELLNKRLHQRIPVAYLTQTAWFAGMQFFVNENVLIPRSPIAELIESSFKPWIEGKNVKRALDLCTGSGCIAIASALLAFPEAEVDAVDISPEALRVAQDNIEHYGLQERVFTVKSDLFSALKGMKYDIILSNPPYVDAEEIATMPEEYHHEPRLGLEAGEDGLFFVRQILSQAADFLTPQGLLIVEVGFSQHALMEAYPTVPFLWFDFERGGDGVFMLTFEQLLEYRSLFEVGG